VKYICVTDEQGQNEEIFVFPRSVHHSVFADMVGFMPNTSGPNWERIVRKPVSAGFVDRNGHCHGNSETLRLKSRPEDTNILNGQMNNTRPLRTD